MSLINALVAGATIVSGVVSSIMLFGVALDAVTRGWVRGHVRSWLGIEALHTDHHATQVYLLDLGESHNELAGAVREGADIDDPDRITEVDTGHYQHHLSDEARVERGDFLRGGD